MTGTTDVHSFRPWHLFVLAGLLVSTGAVLIVRPDDPAVLVLLVASIGSASYVGFTVYRALWPLAAADFQERAQIIGGRTRAAMDREKTHVLRAIKELEFDHAMGKVSDTDFQQMKRRLRTQALGLMKQLDADMPDYHDQIAKELAARLQITVRDLAPFRRDDDHSTPTGTHDASGHSDSADAESPDIVSSNIDGTDADDDSQPVCTACDTINESDARFCKSCGAGLEMPA